MHRLIPLALASLIFVSSASSVQAEECEKTAYVGVFSGYVFPPIGELSKKPVIQGGNTVSCGGMSFDLWGSYELSQGSFGKRRGDEVDFTFAYEHEVGPVTVQVGAAYWMLAQFGRSVDDYVDLSVEVKREVHAGALSIEPFLHVSRYVPLGHVRGETLLVPGLRLTLPLDSRWEISAEAARAHNLTYRESVVYGNVTLSRQMDDGWKVRLSVQPTEHARTVFGFSVAKAW